MKTSMFSILIGLSTLFFSFIPVENSTWNMDNNHAKVGFTVTHMLISDVDGYFKKVTATVSSPGEDFTGAVAEMTAEVTSISTDNERRDADLQSSSFFDAAKFSKITFKSTSFTKTQTSNTYLVKGNLTMHGVTKPVTLTAVCRMGSNPMSHKTLAGFKITGTVNRKDFGIGSSVPEAIVSNEVAIYANAEFIKN